MSKKIGFYLIIIFLITSCVGNSKKDKQTENMLNPKVDSLYKLVVAKHDEVMPKTVDISKLTQVLRSKLENTKDEVEKEKILNLLEGLQSAHDAMFDWMGAFKGLHTNEEFYQKKPEQELINYLKDEETKIERVAKIMLESIGYSELYIKDHKK